MVQQVIEPELHTELIPVSIIYRPDGLHYIGVVLTVDQVFKSSVNYVGMNGTHHILRECYFSKPESPDEPRKLILAPDTYLTRKQLHKAIMEDIDKVGKSISGFNYG